MMKKLYCFFFLFFTYQSYLFAQEELPVARVFRGEQVKFLTELESVSLDSSIVYPISRFAGTELGMLYESVVTDPSLPVSGKEKAIRSTMYFMRELSRNLQQEKIYIYDVPPAVIGFRSLLGAILHKQSWLHNVQAWEPGKLQLMASAFAQYPEHELLEDLATYKRISASPEYIFTFLTGNPGFRFADSLLRDAAAHDPGKFIRFIGKDPPVIDLRLSAAKNPYVRQILELAHEKEGTELMPFITEIVEGNLVKDSILARRASATGYFQLLVNTLIASANNPHRDPATLTPLRRGIREKALQFYTTQVNHLHNEPDAVRFASVKNLRPQDLYYILTSSGDELYTSSYLGLYRRLKAYFPHQRADSLFSIVGDDDFHVFIRLAANYNVLADFLKSMSADKAQAILGKYLSGIGSSSEKGLDRAMDIGDTFGALTGDPLLMDFIGEEINGNMERSRASRHYLGMRLYSILQQVFNLVRQDGNFTRLWETLGNYDLLLKSDLRGSGGKITEVLLFYGDEDGVASFQNFINGYQKDSRWIIERNSQYVHIRSKEDSLFSIYANMPLDISGELDQRAQDSMFMYLQSQSLEPSIIIHRGHSYHLDKTLQRLTPSVRLAVLGSCGGYNRAISIANINPDVHIIGSKKTGSKLVNDPMIEEINNMLVSGRDLDWPTIWNRLTGRFSGDAGRLSLFNEYFPPSGNAGLFVLKLFGIYQGKSGLLAGKTLRFATSDL